MRLSNHLELRELRGFGIFGRRLPLHVELVVRFCPTSQLR
jgi:hypothetical protein